MKILLVEDTVRLAQSIKKGLEQEAYSVDVAHDGEEGYDLALSEAYDLLILDWMLPGMSGIEILEEYRKDGGVAPVLMLTAKSELDDVVEGLDTGADDYLTKPFAFEELVARIKALLRRPKKVAPDILECCNIKLNLTNHEVTVKNESIELSRKEFSLLEYLLRHKEQTVTKDQIIDHVWNFDSDVLPNTVEVYIGYLRNKLDKPFGTKHIQTVRGFGYKLAK